jgi:hypothetical protein
VPFGSCNWGHRSSRWPALAETSDGPYRQHESQGRHRSDAQLLHEQDHFGAAGGLLLDRLV